MSANINLYERAIETGRTAGKCNGIYISPNMCVCCIYFASHVCKTNILNVHTKKKNIEYCGWFSYNVVRVPPVFLVFVFFCDVVYMRQRVTWGFIRLPDIKSKCLYVHLYIASTCTDCSISKFIWVGSKCVNLSYPG